MLPKLLYVWPVPWLILQDLGKELSSELSGNFKTLCVEMLLGPAEFDAKQLNKAIKVTTALNSTLIVSLPHPLFFSASSFS